MQVSGCLKAPSFFPTCSARCLSVTLLTTLALAAIASVTVGTLALSGVIAGISDGSAIGLIVIGGALLVALALALVLMSRAEQAQARALSQELSSRQQVKKKAAAHREGPPADDVAYVNRLLDSDIAPAIARGASSVNVEIPSFRVDGRIFYLRDPHDGRPMTESELDSLCHRAGGRYFATHGVWLTFSNHHNVGVHVEISY